MTESIFTGPGEVLLAPETWGDVVPIRLDGSQDWRVGRDAFLACTMGVTRTTKSQGLGKALCEFLPLHGCGCGTRVLNMLSSFGRGPLRVPRERPGGDVGAELGRDHLARAPAWRAVDWYVSAYASHTPPVFLTDCRSRQRPPCRLDRAVQGRAHQRRRSVLRRAHGRGSGLQVRRAFVVLAIPLWILTGSIGSPAPELSTSSQGTPKRSVNGSPGRYPPGPPLHRTDAGLFDDGCTMGRT